MLAEANGPRRRAQADERDGDHLGACHPTKQRRVRTVRLVDEHEANVGPFPARKGLDGSDLHERERISRPVPPA